MPESANLACRDPQGGPGARLAPAADRPPHLGVTTRSRQTPKTAPTPAGDPRDTPKTLSDSSLPVVLTCGDERALRSCAALVESTYGSGIRSLHLVVTHL